MTPREEFLLANPEHFATASGLLPLYDAARAYPVKKPHKIKLVLPNPLVSDIEPYVCADGIMLVEESIFRIKIVQPKSLAGDEVLELHKSMITQCELSTENCSGWLECPRFYAMLKVLDFQLQ